MARIKKFQEIKITLNPQNRAILTILVSLLNAHNVDLGALSKSEDTDKFDGIKYYLAKVGKFLFGFADQETTLLPGDSIELEPEAEILREEYINHLNLTYADVGCKVEQLYAKEIDNPDILIRVILIRLVTIALSERCTREDSDGDKLLSILLNFIKRVRDNELIKKDKLLVYFGTSHVDWLTNIRSMVQAIKAINAHRIMIRHMTDYVTQVTYFLRAQLAVFISDKISKQQIINDEVTNLTLTQIIAEKLQINKFSLQLHDLPYSELEDRYPDDAVRRRCNLLRQIEAIHQIIDGIDTLIRLASWSLFFRGILDINGLKNLLSEFHKRFQEAANLASGEPIFKTKGGKALAACDLANPATLSFVFKKCEIQIENMVENSALFDYLRNRLRRTVEELVRIESHLKEFDYTVSLFDPVKLAALKEDNWGVLFHKKSVIASQALPGRGRSLCCELNARGPLLDRLSERKSTDSIYQFKFPNDLKSSDHFFRYSHGEQKDSHSGTVRHLAVSPRGEIISVGWDSFIRIWNANPLQPIIEQCSVKHQPKADIESLALFPQKQWLATGTYYTSGEIIIWDIRQQKPKQIRQLTPGSGSVWCLKFIASKSLLIAGTGMGRVIAWNLDDWSSRTIVEAKKNNNSDIKAMEIYQGHIVVGNNKGGISIWGSEKKNHLLGKSKDKPHKGEIKSLLLMNNGLLVSGGKYGEIKFWKIDSHDYSVNHIKNLELLHGNTSKGTIYALLELKDGRLLSACNRGRVCLWSTVFPYNGSVIQQADSKILALSCVYSMHNDTDYLMLSTGSVIRRIKLHKDTINIDFNSGEAPLHEHLTFLVKKEHPDTVSVYIKHFGSYYNDVTKQIQLRKICVFISAIFANTLRATLDEQESLIHLTCISDGALPYVRQFLKLYTYDYIGSIKACSRNLENSSKDVSFASADKAIKFKQICALWKSFFSNNPYSIEYKVQAKKASVSRTLYGILCIHSSFLLEKDESYYAVQEVVIGGKLKIHLNLAVEDYPSSKQVTGKGMSQHASKAGKWSVGASDNRTELQQATHPMSVSQP